MPSVERKGKWGAPANFQKSAIRAPNRAGEPSKKLTTGSRIARRRKSGKWMQYHERTWLAQRSRNPPLPHVIYAAFSVTKAPGALRCSLDELGDFLRVREEDGVASRQFDGLGLGPAPS
jgi:hypothetical protein